MVHWSREHGLQLNLQKSKTMLFSSSPSTTPIPLPDIHLVKEIKILGVILQDNLKWDNHVKTMVTTAARRLYALRILNPILRKDEMVSVYYAVIRSVLEYSAPLLIGLPAHLRNQLERVQSRSHRLICKFSRFDDPCNCSQFPPLHDRRTRISTRIFLQAHANAQHRLNSLLPPFSTRTGLPIQPPCRTLRYRMTFIPYVSALLNGSLIVEPSLFRFFHFVFSSVVIFLFLTLTFCNLCDSIILR